MGGHIIGIDKEVGVRCVCAMFSCSHDTEYYLPNDEVGRALEYMND